MYRKPSGSLVLDKAITGYLSWQRNDYLDFINKFIASHPCDALHDRTTSTTRFGRSLYKECLASDLSLRQAISRQFDWLRMTGLTNAPGNLPDKASATRSAALACNSCNEPSE